MPIALRFATTTDGAAVAAIYGHYVLQDATSFELSPPDGAEMASRIDGLQRHYPWLVAEDAGDVIGYAYAAPHRTRPGYRWSVEVSVYVSRDRHRGRVGRALYSALFEVLALQGFANAYAGVTLPNVASVAFHEAMGFRPVGTYRKVGFKSGQWHDVAWFALDLAPHLEDPAEPRPIAELRREGWVPGYLQASAALPPQALP